MSKLVDLKVTEFAELLASDQPAPGGGSVAALAGAQAAALMAMVCRLTIGEKKYAEVDAEATEALPQLEQLQAQLLALVDKDTAAYNLFGDAFAMAKETDEEKQARTRAIRNAAKQATAVPAQTMEAAARVARLIAGLYEKTNRNCLSDAGVGMQMAWTAVLGAAFNVRINLPSTKDEAFNAEHAQRVRQVLDEIGPLNAQVTDAIGRSLS